MSSATLTSPPTATEKLVVDTDVASFVFKWHPEFAPRYVAIMRGSELVVSFLTLAEMRQGRAFHRARGVFSDCNSERRGAKDQRSGDDHRQIGRGEVHVTFLLNFFDEVKRRIRAGR